jgi:hypothetical protein
MPTTPAMCEKQVNLRLGISKRKCVSLSCTKDHIAGEDVFLPPFRARLRRLPAGEYRKLALRAHDAEVRRRLESAAIDPVLKAAAAATVLAKRLSDRAAEVLDHAARVAETKYWDDEEDRRLE